MRRDNRGISIFEVMVVIAIMAVLGTVGAVTIHGMLGRPAQECAKKVQYSLERHRSVAASKKDAYYRLYMMDRDLYLEEHVNNSGSEGGGGSVHTKLGSTVNVTYVLGSDAPAILGGTRDSGGLTLRYDRSSGAFKPVTGTQYCTSITVSRANRSYTINLVPLTGKVYLD